MKELNLQDILENTKELSEKKVGYVVIIGRPNTGKSTFINTLIGEKVAITSHVPQTTRNKILAIYNDDNSQIIFFDTPGLHKSEKIINQEINSQALSSIQDADVILYFIDSSRARGVEEEYVESLILDSKKPVFYVYTKRDLAPQIELRTGGDVFEISSKEKSGLDDLVGAIKEKLSWGPILFPDDYYTKQDIYFRISEIIREKLFGELKQEIPHSIYVGVEEIEDDEKGVKKISAYVYTETDSQKYIVIGKNGSLITKVGKSARLELEDIFEQKVFLSLRVKVRKNWRKDENLIKKILK